MACMTIKTMDHHRNSPMLKRPSSFENVHERLGRLNLDYEGQSSELLNASLRSGADTSSAMSIDDDDSIIARVRREVTKLLVMLLQAQLPNNTPQQLHKMATHLEQRLYQSSPTFGDYCNTSTLETRLRVVLKAMKSRLLHKQKRISSTKLRTQALKEALNRRYDGQSTYYYEKMESIVQTIKCEKNELVGSACPKCHPKEGPAVSAFSQSKTLPQPIRALFFQTSLVDAFDKYSPQRLQTVDWNRLLEQAETNLAVYYAWKAENYVCYR